MAERGFTALEDNGMRGRSVEEQERIAKEMQRLNMTMGVFVATADFGNVTFASNDKAKQDAAVKEVKDSLETAKRVNAKWMTVVPGRYDVGREWDYQTAYVVETLKRCAEVCEPAGVVMVLEALNPWRDHAGSVPEQNSAGLCDLSGGRFAVVQTPLRYVSSADYRGQYHSEHRPRVERSGVFSGRR